MEPHVRKARAFPWWRALGTVAGGWRCVRRSRSDVARRRAKGHVGGAAAAAWGACVSLLIGRSMWAQSEGGQVVPGQPTPARRRSGPRRPGCAGDGGGRAGPRPRERDLELQRQPVPVLAGAGQVSSGGTSTAGRSYQRPETEPTSPPSRGTSSSLNRAARWPPFGTAPWPPPRLGMYGPGSNNITDDEFPSKSSARASPSHAPLLGRQPRTIVPSSPGPPYYAHTDNERRNLRRPGRP